MLENVLVAYSNFDKDFGKLKRKF